MLPIHAPVSLHIYTPYFFAQQKAQIIILLYAIFAVYPFIQSKYEESHNDLHRSCPKRY